MEKQKDKIQSLVWFECEEVKPGQPMSSRQTERERRR